jgi:glycosyltransferase involved in cell wall biosynthesis
VADAPQSPAPAAPRFSVVIPAYQAEPFLERALRSVRAQDVASLEVVVVDDGSSDAGGEVARRFGASHALPVRVVRQQNAGAAAARNRGVAEARGELVAFLDADDEWLPGHLQRADAILSRHPELCWVTAPYRRQEAGGRVEERRPSERGLDGECFPDYFAISGNWINIMDTMVIRREVFAEVGVFDTGLATGEDLDLWFRIALRHPRIGYAREPAATYWWVQASLTRLGPYPTARALEIVRRNRERAAAQGGETLARVQPVLERWLVEIVRNAALAGEREALREIARSGLARLPAPWQLVSLAARLTPPPLWRALVRVWRALR